MPVGSAESEPSQQVLFRCLEDGHTFAERRDPRAPLVLRQSAWCAVHDSPAVGTREGVPPAATPPGRY
jgi:hypothetical protein